MAVCSDHDNGISIEIKFLASAQIREIHLIRWIEVSLLTPLLVEAFQQWRLFSECVNKYAGDTLRNSLFARGAAEANREPIPGLDSLVLEAAEEADEGHVQRLWRFLDHRRWQQVCAIAWCCNGPPRSPRSRMEQVPGDKSTKYPSHDFASSLPTWREITSTSDACKSGHVRRSSAHVSNTTMPTIAVFIFEEPRCWRIPVAESTCDLAYTAFTISV